MHNTESVRENETPEFSEIFHKKRKEKKENLQNFGGSPGKNERKRKERLGPRLC